MSDSSHRDYMLQAIQIAEECKPEDERNHPKVAAVLVTTDGKVITAYRGEQGGGGHAEYTLLSKKVTAEGVSAANGTLYVTLEPCTTRRHPKLPCAEWIRDTRIGHVFIGMLDPNPSITGRGIMALRDRNISVSLFDVDLQRKIEEQNRDFMRQHRPLSGVTQSVIPPDPSKRRLDHWYRVVNTIYIRRNFERPTEAIFAHLVEAIGGISVLASQKHAPGIDPEHQISKAVAWWMALCGSVGVSSVENMLWLKFPGCCPYCLEDPHQRGKCERVKRESSNPDWEVLAGLAAKNRSLIPGTLADWQRMFLRVYPVNNGEKYDMSLAKLSEELGELAEAIRVRTIRPGYFMNEASDVFAWLMRVQSIYDLEHGGDEQSAGSRLQESLAADYPDRCMRCQNQFCTCPPILPETVGRIANEMPNEMARIMDPEALSKMFSLGSWEEAP